MVGKQQAEKEGELEGRVRPLGLNSCRKDMEGAGKEGKAVPVWVWHSWRNTRKGFHCCKELERRLKGWAKISALLRKG